METENKNDKKKLLIALQLIRRGGVELVAINFARNLDLQKYDVTFLLINANEHHDDVLEAELKEEGFGIIKLPFSAKGYMDKYRFIDRLFETEHFDIVHSHVIFFSAIVLKAAKKNGIKVRAAHSHAIKWNSRENIIYKLYKNIMRLILNKNATVKLACCKAAGEFLYGKKEYEKSGIFIANGIDTKKYQFDESIRAEKREEFGIAPAEILVGHIGTLYRIKNQTFLEEIFAQMLKSNSNMRLLLVGEAVDGELVTKKAEALGIADKLIIAGQRSDIPQLLQAMDIMIFPSLHEALPVSLIEAQAAKLPCLISDAVTTEVKFNDNVDFMSLSEPADKWAEKAFELLKINRENISVDDLIKSYDINLVAEKLEKIYLA